MNAFRRGLRDEKLMCSCLTFQWFKGQQHAQNVMHTTTQSLALENVGTQLGFSIQQCGCAHAKF